MKNFDKINSLEEMDGLKLTNLWLNKRTEKNNKNTICLVTFEFNKILSLRKIEFAKINDKYKLLFPCFKKILEEKYESLTYVFCEKVREALIEEVLAKIEYLKAIGEWEEN